MFFFYLFTDILAFFVLQVTKKKSAEEMHYESWGSSLTYALNGRK
jgi:hypothetical protein